MPAKRSKRSLPAPPPAGMPEMEAAPSLQDAGTIMSEAIVERIRAAVDLGAATLRLWRHNTRASREFVGNLTGVAFADFSAAMGKYTAQELATGSDRWFLAPDSLDVASAVLLVSRTHRSVLSRWLDGAPDLAPGFREALALYREAGDHVRYAERFLARRIA